MSDPRQVVIIGSGPAGLTAAIYAARANLEPLMFEGATWGGQLMITTEVENYPGFTDGIQGPELMEVWRKQSQRFGTEIRTSDVTEVDFGRRPFVVRSGNEEVRARAVVVSTGAVARTMAVAGEQKYTGHGLSYCATCDGFFFRDKKILVVGGGDSAMEEALFLTKFGSSVDVLHRRDGLRASKIMADRGLAHPKINFQWNTVVEEVLGDGTLMTGARVKDTVTGELRDIEAEGLFVAIGHDPATKLFRGQLDMDDAGYIHVTPGTSYTSVEGVFAGGDCVDHVYRQAVTAAGMGCMAAIDAERWLSEQDS